MRSIISRLSKPHISQPYTSAGTTILPNKSSWHANGRLYCLILRITPYMAFRAWLLKLTTTTEIPVPNTRCNNNINIEISNTCSWNVSCRSVALRSEKSWERGPKSSSQIFMTGGYSSVANLLVDMWKCLRKKNVYPYKLNILKKNEEEMKINGEKNLWN